MGFNITLYSVYGNTATYSSVFNSIPNIPLTPAKVPIHFWEGCYVTLVIGSGSDCILVWYTGGTHSPLWRGSFHAACGPGWAFAERLWGERGLLVIGGNHSYTGGESGAQRDTDIFSGPAATGSLLHISPVVNSNYNFRLSEWMCFPQQKAI